LNGESIADLGSGRTVVRLCYAAEAELVLGCGTEAELVLDGSSIGRDVTPLSLRG
jgi:hypothetical protein